MGTRYPVFGFMMFLSYPLPLDIWELAYWEGIGFMDHGRSCDVRMVPDRLGSPGCRFCQLSVFLQSFASSAALLVSLR